MQCLTLKCLYPQYVNSFICSINISCKISLKQFNLHESLYSMQDLSNNERHLFLKTYMFCMIVFILPFVVFSCLSLICCSISHLLIAVSILDCFDLSHIYLGDICQSLTFFYLHMFNCNFMIRRII